MPKQQFILNLPDSLITALKARAEVEGVGPNELIIAVIAQYLGSNQPANNAAFQKRLVLLETRLAGIEVSMGELVA